MKNKIYTLLILLLIAGAATAGPDKAKKNKRKKSGFTSIYGKSKQAGRTHYGCFNTF